MRTAAELTVRRGADPARAGAHSCEPDVYKRQTLHNLKELRPGSTGTSEVRILFIFDPQRQAVLLVAGDKSDQWSEWYERSIPIAETRYERWLAGEYNDEIGE